MSENLVTAAQKAVSYTVTVFLFSLSYYIIPGPFLFFFFCIASLRGIIHKSGYLLQN